MNAKNILQLLVILIHVLVIGYLVKYNLDLEAQNKCLDYNYLNGEYKINLLEKNEIICSEPLFYSLHEIPKEKIKLSELRRENNEK